MDSKAFRSHHSPIVEGDHRKDLAGVDILKRREISIFILFELRKRQYLEWNQAEDILAEHSHLEEDKLGLVEDTLAAAKGIPVEDSLEMDILGSRSRQLVGMVELSL